LKQLKITQYLDKCITIIL